METGELISNFLTPTRYIHAGHQKKHYILLCKWSHSYQKKDADQA